MSDLDEFFSEVAAAEVEVQLQKDDNTQQALDVVKDTKEESLLGQKRRLDSSPLPPFTQAPASITIVSKPALRTVSEPIKPTPVYKEELSVFEKASQSIPEVSTAPLTTAKSYNGKPLPPYNAPSSSSSSSSSSATSSFSFSFATTSTTTTTATTKASANTSATTACAIPIQKQDKTYVRSSAGEVWVDPTLEEWPENDFRLFVGDIGKEVTAEQLSQHFSRYPSFAKARVIPSHIKGRGYGFVSFLDPMDCARALREQNGKYLGSRPMAIKRADWKKRDIQEVKKKEKKKAKLAHDLGL